MTTIVPLREEHLEDAAALVSERYRHLRAQVPYLPTQYAEAGTYLPLLKNMFNAPGTGVAAFRGDRLVGFLTGWQMPSFRGKRSTYSPEWANAADLDNSAQIYKEMYSHLAAEWVAEQYTAHYISLFPNDTEALLAWYWLGFGMISVDALRSLEPLPPSEANVQIRRAGLQDIDQVMGLRDALRKYMESAPIFLLSDEMKRDYFVEWLQNPEKVAWLGIQDQEPVALMMVGPAADDVCTIIQDEQTTSIYAAFTQEKARAGGVATALLDQVLRSARGAGYERCAVSFEPMNILGTRFWLRYFQPVCFSVVRYVDERVTQK